MIHKLLHGVRLWYRTIHNELPNKYFLEYLLDSTSSDLAVFYTVPQDRTCSPVLLSSCGRFQTAPLLDPDSESVAFLIESGETLICNRTGGEFFADIFLNYRFKSAATLLFGSDLILFLNSLQGNNYGMHQLSFLDSLGKLVKKIT